MSKIDSLIREIDAIDRLPVVRKEIVDLIAVHLEQRKDSLDEWETCHFANAIGSLALNVSSLIQPTTSWLRLCLVDLEKALLSRTMRPKLGNPRHARRVHLSYDDLLQALAPVKARIYAILDHWSGSGSGRKPGS